jgi:hypothetical protein
MNPIWRQHGCKSSALAVILTAILVVSSLIVPTGCTPSPQGDTTPTSTATESSRTAITVFGTTVCPHIVQLTLPTDIRISRWLARSGQVLDAGDPIFQLDLELLRHTEQAMQQRRLVLADSILTQNLRIEQGQADLSWLQSAAQADLDEGLRILYDLALASSRRRKSPLEAELLAYLEALGGLSQYGTLVGLTQDAAAVTDRAKPLLRQLTLARAAEARALMLELTIWRQQLLVLQTELADLDREATSLADFRQGERQGSLGTLDADGVFRAGSAWLLDAPLSSPGLLIPSGTRIAGLAELPLHIAVFQVEEQLTADLAVGDRVQISPLSDRTVVWIGSIVFIPGKADIINGETVLAVHVQVDEELPAPGLTLVGKILPSVG